MSANSKISVCQFITHGSDAESELSQIERMCSNGIDWIQLRMKNVTDDYFERTALEALKLCTKYGAKLIINDRIHIAKKIGAHGVHIGKEDIPVSEAREFLGEQFIIGSTANSFEDILKNKQEADYIGLGPYSSTSTKKNLSAILGKEGIDAILKQLQKHQIDIPIIAIGGITSLNVNHLAQTRIAGIALSGGLIDHKHPIEFKNTIEDLFSRKTILN